MVEFGDDSLLMEFVASANQLKLDAGNLRAGLNHISQQVQSARRNADVQLLIMQVNDLMARSSRLKENVLEISRND